MVESAGSGNIDAGELEKFRGLADGWWDPKGPMRPLHQLNPCRIGWIRDELCRQLGLDPTSRRPFAGLRMLDVGCGGGLLCEPLARMGAVVTGLDPTPETIETAAWHSREVGLAIDYRTGTVEELAEQGETFRVVLALEVVEHTPDADAFIGSLAAVTESRGVLVLSTLSRTWRAWLLGVIGAERVLGWLPTGTHDWHRFVRPSEMARSLRAHGLTVTAIAGMSYDVRQAAFTTSRDTSVNYILTARKY